jgi:glycerol kinase
MTGYILAIDQGTSGTKCVVFDGSGKEICKVVEPLKTHYLDNGFVEQEPEGIFQNVLAAVKKCVIAFEASGNNRSAIISCGISNQRETFVLWNDKGEPLYNAVVWQCKRSIDICKQLQEKGIGDEIKHKTGLLLDPYFSGTKVMWLAENNAGIQHAISAGNACFGTVDSWLLYKLTKGETHATDYTNASRTLFFNLHTLSWDKALLKHFNLLGLRLPALQPSASNFGESDFDGLFPAPIAITAMIGDSHAAAFGEGCFEKGESKATLGTGCSVLLNTGASLPGDSKGFVTTICWSTEKEIHYALEGVIVSCGAIIEWIKNELRLFDDIAEVQSLIDGVKDSNGVFIIPAFSGLGSPHWDMQRKAEIVGLTFDCKRNHIVRAALETVAFQVKEVLECMEEESNSELKSLSLNGGMTSNKFVLDFLATLLGKPVYFGVKDASAQGAAFLAGLKAGLYPDIQTLKTIIGKKQTIEPLAENGYHNAVYSQWRELMVNS